MAMLTALTLLTGVASASPTPASAIPVGAPDTVVVHTGSLTLRGLLWRPDGPGPFPAVLYNHGSGPQSDFTRPARLGPLFARHGYVVLYLFRRGAGLSADQGTDSETLMNRASAANGRDGRNALQLRLLDAELEDVRAGLALLRARPEVDTSRLSVVGYSFGGQLSLLLAEHETNLRALVVVGAAAGSWEGSPKLRERLLAAVRRTTAPAFFIHAANDFSVSPGRALDAEMARAGRVHALKLYPAVGSTPQEGHDFIHQRIPSWEPDVFAFLDRYARQAWTLKSSILNEDRKVLVHLPAGYDTSSASYPVLYLLDGTSAFLLDMVAVTSRLRVESNGPEMILVAIENTDRNRDMMPVVARDLPGPPRAEAFLGFLTQELIPDIERTYRTRQPRILFGKSLSGLFTIYALLAKPTAFDGYVGCSAGWFAENHEWFMALTTRAFQRKDLYGGRRVFMANSLQDRYDPDQAIHRRMMDFSAMVRDKLGDEMAYRYDTYPDHPHVPRPCLSDGLRFVSMR